MSHSVERRYERRARAKWGRPQCSLRAGPRIDAAIAASHNAFGGDLCDDPPVRPTVVIVDDHPEFRESAAALLEAEGFAVIGEAADGDEAIAAVERLRPQVVLLDIQLPDLDGLAGRAVAGVRSAQGRAHLEPRGGRLRPRLEAAAALGFIPKRELSGSALAALVG